MDSDSTCTTQYLEGFIKKKYMISIAVPLTHIIDRNPKFVVAVGQHVIAIITYKNITVDSMGAL